MIVILPSLPLHDVGSVGDILVIEVTSVSVVTVKLPTPSQLFAVPVTEYAHGVETEIEFAVDPFDHV